LKNTKRLVDYSTNKFSQFGEDGIIEKIFDIIGKENNICVEVGAWDGLHLSNTAHLWKNGWSAILIECDEMKIPALIKNTIGYKCTNIHTTVGPKGSSSIDFILKSKDISKNIDFMSIDIDGNDYYLFKSLNNYYPRVICCEYNPTIPPSLDIRAPYPNKFGCSALSLINLAESKGYYFIAMTKTNCFFVLNKYKSSFDDYITDMESLFPYDLLNYIITDYDGFYAFTRKPLFGAKLPLGIKLIGNYFQLSQLNIFSKIKKIITKYIL